MHFFWKMLSVLPPAFLILQENLPPRQSSCLNHCLLLYERMAKQENTHPGSRKHLCLCVLHSLHLHSRWRLVLNEPAVCSSIEGGILFPTPNPATPGVEMRFYLLNKDISWMMHPHESWSSTVINVGQFPLWLEPTLLGNERDIWQTTRGR
jgi:hypothetical protein